MQVLGYASTVRVYRSLCDGHLAGTRLRSLALGLRGAPPELIDQMLGCMSARAADTIRDDMATAPPAKRSEVEDAQRTILASARKLADAGEIVIGNASADFV